MDSMAEKVNDKLKENSMGGVGNDKWDYKQTKKRHQGFVRFTLVEEKWPAQQCSHQFITSLLDQ